MKSATIRKADIVNGLTLMAGMPVKVKDLALGAGIVENNTSYPTTRGLIRELIEEGFCIGSSNQGYFLMDNGKEVQSYLNSLLERQIAISIRIASVYSAAKDKGIL